MSEMGWRARIDTTEGATLGAGLLISASQVLTCAHLVDGLTGVCVAFPNVDRASRLPAKVAWRGPWQQVHDPGDVALVELDKPVQMDPCRFSGLDALKPGRASDKLGALGFPGGHGRDGLHVTLHTSDDRVLGGEWLQIDVELGHLATLSRGFSGAGVCVSETGQVVGMITDAVKDHDGGGYIGRMLPLSTIRRYWEGIDDLLPLSWLEPRQRQELRAALDGAKVATDLDNIFGRAFPAFLRVPPFGTPWAAIRYVGESVPGDDRFRLFLLKLTPYLDAGARSRLTDWARRWLPEAVAEFQQAQPPVTSIVIMVRTPTRKGATHRELTARPLVEGTWVAGPQTHVVHRDKIQAMTEKIVTSQVSQLQSPDLMIEFAVRPDEMCLPFEEWQYREPGASHPRPMRSVPLVVWHVARLDPRNFAAHRARQRWRTLRGRGKTALVTVDCRLAYDFEEFRDWLEADAELCALAYGVMPKREWLEAALDTGVPIMVWPRWNCPGSGEAHDAHEGFLSKITGALAAADPDLLPTEVMRLRKEARSPVTGHERHHGRYLTLFWDDPARLPDPPLAEGG